MTKSLLQLLGSDNFPYTLVLTRLAPSRLPTASAATAAGGVILRDLISSGFGSFAEGALTWGKRSNTAPNNASMMESTLLTRSFLCS